MLPARARFDKPRLRKFLDFGVAGVAVGVFVARAVRGCGGPAGEPRQALTGATVACPDLPRIPWRRFFCFLVFWGDVFRSLFLAFVHGCISSGDAWNRAKRGGKQEKDSLNSGCLIKKGGGPGFRSACGLVGGGLRGGAGGPPDHPPSGSGPDHGEAARTEGVTSVLSRPGCRCPRQYPDRCRTRSCSGRARSPCRSHRSDFSSRPGRCADRPPFRHRVWR